MRRRPSSACRVLGSAALLAACGGAGGPAPARPSAPAARPAAPAPSVDTTVADVDAALEAVWQRAGAVPAPPADDATWLRRVTLDVTGTVPTPDVVRAFLADASPDKRRALVARLVRSDAYAEHFAAYWDDVLLGPAVRSPFVDRVAFRAFLREAFRGNAPWSATAFRIVAAEGLSSAGGVPRTPGALAMDAPSASRGAPEDDEARDDDAGASPNGALGFVLKYEQAPEDLAGTVARTFLGTQIQCAQCHDHKTEPWKTTDFRAFAAPFLHTRVRPLEPRKGPGVRRAGVEDAPRPAPRFAKNPERRAIAATPPRALDGTPLATDASSRRALAAWTTSKDNASFARAFVNRVWSQLLGRGFVNPVDDLRPSNPPLAPEVEERLVRAFVAHGHDVRWLVETVAATRAYGLSAAPPVRGTAPFARFELSPLGPEELVNALFTAAGEGSVLGARPEAKRQEMRRTLAQRYAFLFDVDEENAQADYAGTLGQALALSNGALVTAVVSVAARSEAARAPDGLLEELWLRLLGRAPDAAELARARRTLDEAGGGPARARAFEDVAWSLVGSSEFAFNH